MRHGLERRKTKAFVEGRKHENFCDVVKDPQHFDGHESHEADIILYATAHHGAAQIGMLRELVANNDELQIRMEVLLEKFRLQRRECLNDPHHVLMGTD